MRRKVFAMSLRPSNHNVMQIAPPRQILDDSPIIFVCVNVSNKSPEFAIRQIAHRSRSNPCLKFSNLTFYIALTYTPEMVSLEYNRIHLVKNPRGRPDPLRLVVLKCYLWIRNPQRWIAHNFRAWRSVVLPNRAELVIARILQIRWAY